MKYLSQLFENIKFSSPNVSLEQAQSIAVRQIACDSREVLEGAVFFAIAGACDDGTKYIQDALSKGALAVVTSKDQADKIAGLDVALVIVEDIREALAYASNVFFERPSSRLNNIGITGTNGKSSVAWICASLLDAIGESSALIGTLGQGVFNSKEQGNALEKTLNTTPSPIEIQSLLSQAEQKGAKYSVLEVTSQGLFHKRSRFIEWNAAIFSNLTRDHLDLHGDFETYGKLKNELFEVELAASSKNKRIALINIDDNWGQGLFDSQKSSGSPVEVLSYSVSNSKADIFGKGYTISRQGIELEAEVLGRPISLKSKLVGIFNVENILASVGVLTALGLDLGKLSAALPEVSCVPGRLDSIDAGDFSIFVDYAHTPDALYSVLGSIVELKPNRLISVFGCGGDRDKGKRPLMAEAVAEFSDLAIATSDNPRTESMESIIDDIVPGFDSAKRKPGFKWLREEDRRQAISMALEDATSGDIVLIAGKGHEDYQEINGKRFDFDDRKVCLELLKQKGLL